MSMKANVLRDALGNITIQISGSLDYTNGLPLQEKLKHLVDENPHAQVTVDLGGLSFIGSSGICHFVESIHLLNKDNHSKQRIGLKNVSNEFKRIFKLFSAEEAQLIWDEFDMDSNDTQSMGKLAGRKTSFEN